MTRPKVSSHRGRLAATVLSLVLLGLLVPLASVSAAGVTVTSASGGSAISADSNGTTGTGTYTPLTGPVITEHAAGNLGNGTIVLHPPAGFQFNPASGSASVGGGCTSLNATLAQSANPTITITGAPSMTHPCSITVSGLGVRPSSATFAGAGSITNTGTGTNAPKPGNYGTLTEVAGAPRLTFTSGAIANTTGGATLAPNPGFHDQDAEGNDRASDSVTLAIRAGTGTAGATLTCATNPKNTGVGGNVTFSACSIDRPGTGYVLRATTGSAFVDTNAFNVSTGPATKLVFETSPAAASASLLTPQPSVAVTDAGGNVITTDNHTVVTLAISAHPDTFSCTGGLSRVVSVGVATFAWCTQTSNGTYTLRATSSPALVAATSAAFTIASQPANLSVTPSSTVIIWGGSVTLTVALAPNGAGKTVQLQASRDNATWSTVTTLALDASGRASFFYRPSDNRFYRANFLATPDLSASASPSARVVVRQISLLRPTNGGTVKTISHGTSIVFTSTIRPNRPDLPQAHANVVVYKLLGGRWTLIETQIVAVNAAGVATLAVTFSSTGQYYVRSQAIPTPLNANSGWSLPLERYNVV